MKLKHDDASAYSLALSNLRGAQASLAHAQRNLTWALDAFTSLVQSTGKCNNKGDTDDG